METQEAVQRAMTILGGFLDEMIKEASGVNGVTYQHIFALFAKTIVMNFVNTPADTTEAIRLISTMIHEGASYKVGLGDRVVH